jgi:hypothetical protein
MTYDQEQRFTRLSNDVNGNPRSYIGVYELADLALPCWIKAERKIRRWLDRHIPRKAVERRDWMDCYL